MTAWRRLVLIGGPPEMTDTEHLRLALEFADPDVGADYLREQGREELIAEFERLSEGEV